MPIGGRTVGDARVGINTATADELSESLPGIEPERARLLVAHREEHGYFRGPEDLGRVEGIDRETVAALVPYIDWSVPKEQAGPHRREWGWALAAAATLLAFLWQLAFGSLPRLVRAIPSSEALGIWNAAADTAILAGLTLGLSGVVAYFLTEDRRRARKAVLVSVAGFGVAVIAYASAAFVTASRFLFFDPDWAGPRRNPQDLVIFPIAVAVALMALPVLLVLWRPALAASHRLERLFDMGLALAALALVLAVWASGGASPTWFSVLNGLWGLFFGYVAIRALRSGESPFFKLASFLTPERYTPDRPADTEAAWGTWLNVRLPDVEDQRALKRYLDGRYPGPRGRSVLYAATVGGSLWLVAQSVGGAVEWLVGRGLERVIGL
jgi:competence ComEA-like helix-hairpin-helix protein